MPTILDPELQCPLFHYGLVHLYPPEILTVYGACVALRETIEGDSEWLYGHCRHVSPHSYGDVPIETWSELQRWYKDGKLHWDMKLHWEVPVPAEIFVHSSQLWYKDGKLHRGGDLPAKIGADGSQFWYKDGKMQLGGDLPTEIWAHSVQK